MWGFPGGSVVKDLCLAVQETWVRSLCWKIPWKRKWQPTSYSCLGNPMDRGVWQAAAHGVAKKSDMTEPELAHNH